MCNFRMWPWKVPKWPWFWAEVAVKAWRGLATLPMGDGQYYVIIRHLRSWQEVAEWWPTQPH
jgi:hypothetical protein